MNLRKHLVISCLLPFLLHQVAQAQNNLQSGPMVGYSANSDVRLWVQTKEPAKVHFEYWETSAPAVRKKTEVIETLRDEACTGQVSATEVDPGKHYSYELFIDGQHVKRDYPLQFQTQPILRLITEATTSTIALGSCAYINEAQFDNGRDYPDTPPIFSAIAQAKPDAMLWLGDNVYLRSGDWNSRIGILRRYTHTRSTPSMQPLLGATHNYAIWDDHDVGPNDADRGWWNRSAAREAFQLFWPNPGCGLDNEHGITTSFQWLDAQFFLLDNRYFRTPNARRTGGRHTLLGKRQREWLIDALVSSKSRFKFIAVGGQFLNPVPQFETWASCAPEERQEILDALAKERVEGVIFLTGDRHHTELSMLERPGHYPLYDLTVSPLSSSVHMGGEKEANDLRVEGTLVSERNFGLLTFSGPMDKRKLTISIRNESENELWHREIMATELKNEETTAPR